MGSAGPVDWRKAILGGPDLLESGSGFRHALRFVKVSDIAEQYYCEEKIDLGYLLGKVPSDAKLEGEKIHEKALMMEEVEPEQVVPAIEKLKRVSATFTVFGRVGPLVIVGRPDAIAFQDGRPRWVLELKTTGMSPVKLWTNQVVQVQTYGLLLEKMGFDVSNLDLVLVRVRRKDTGMNIAHSFLRGVLELLRSDRYRDFEAEHGGAIKFYIIPYDRSEAERNIEWAQDYWLGKREPIPAHSYRKCQVCEYRDRCDHSMYARG